MAIKALRDYSKIVLDQTFKLSETDLELIDLLVEGESVARWNRLVFSLQEMAHDLDADCPCWTCNVVRNIVARYSQ